MNKLKTKKCYTYKRYLLTYDYTRMIILYAAPKGARVPETRLEKILNG
jgi:hypothetical protein